MSYQTALTIADVMNDIQSRKYLLPSIQREFVWNQEQIETLFDSLMRGYPINSFLFWEVPEEKKNSFRFYEFLRDYHSKDSRHNPLADTNGLHGITAILDGQQRLTSLYIGLKGTYASKLPYYWWNNPKAYPKKRLYLNLFDMQETENDDNCYQFRFMTEDDVKKANDSGKVFWFRVGEILDFDNAADVARYLFRNEYLKNVPDKMETAHNILVQLYTIIHERGTISPYIEKTDDLEKVLRIFIRLNKGGTPLGYSDLLLSFVIAQWDELDAREEINGLVDELNRIGREFNVSKDFVLKSCLVLCDIPNIRFKVDNFNRENMLKIESQWGNIRKALYLTLELVASFGFNRDNISSNYALIPIAYYIYQLGCPDNFVDSDKYAEDHKVIKRWFIRALLLHVFRSSDVVLSSMRDIIRNENSNGFPFESIVSCFRGVSGRDLMFTEDRVENLLKSKYGSGETFIILSLLYPWLDYTNLFHVDHIHPKSRFTTWQYNQMGLNEGQAQFYSENVNSLANLQLLQGTRNIAKSDVPFKQWMEEKHSDMEERKAYLKNHYIPDVNYEFSNFEEFFKLREQMIFEKLKEILL